MRLSIFRAEHKFHGFPLLPHFSCGMSKPSAFTLYHYPFGSYSNA